MGVAAMIHVLQDSEGAAEAAARLAKATLSRYASTATATATATATGDAYLALSGGTTPRRLYELLANAATSEIPWSRIHIVWGDERCVPPDDPRSNYRMVAETGLLGHPLAGIHRMPGELPPEEAALAYEESLRALFPGREVPRLDLVIMGMGSDGHVASLFPGSKELDELERWSVATGVHGGVRRLTLTLPVLASAKALILLVTGESKAKAVERAFGGNEQSHGSGIPIRMLLSVISERRSVARDYPSVTCILDEPAASLLRRCSTRLDWGPEPG